MPLLKMDFISSVLALADPVPFTVAILMAKSLMPVEVMPVLVIRVEVGDDMDGVRPQAPAPGNLGFLRQEHSCFVLRLRPVQVGFLHVPRGGGTALGTQPAVH